MVEVIEKGWIVTIIVGLNCIMQMVNILKARMENWTENFVDLNNSGWLIDILTHFWFKRRFV